MQPETDTDNGMPSPLLRLSTLVKAAGAAGKSASEVVKLGRTALKAGMKNGLRGFDLFKYVAKQVSPDLLSAASKNSLLMTKAFYDAIEPVPIRSTLKGLYKGIKRDLKLKSLDDFSGAALTRENIKIDLELTNDGVLKDKSGQSFIRGEKGDLFHVKKNHSNNTWMLVNGDKKTHIINSGGRWWKVNKTKKQEGYSEKTGRLTISILRGFTLITVYIKFVLITLNPCRIIIITLKIIINSIRLNMMKEIIRYV